MGTEEGAEGSDAHKAMAITNPRTAFPPPERSENIRVRSLVIASFWAIVVLFGVPVWLWTTSIHRARLPLEDMLAWADGKVRKCKEIRYYCLTMY